MAAKVVYGSSLEALRFAAKMGTKIILESPSFPPVYESGENKTTWANLYLQLMIEGSVIGGDSVNATRIDDDFVYVVRKGNVLNKLEYKTVYVFSDKEITGLPTPIKKNKVYKVVDFLAPLSLSYPHKNYIGTQERFVKEVHICKKETKSKTEIYLVSNLDEEQLYQFDYSDTMARFKCESILKEHGFKGSTNGDYTRPIKLETVSREIIEPMHYYRDTKKIKFINGN